MVMSAALADLVLMQKACFPEVVTVVMAVILMGIIPQVKADMAEKERLQKTEKMVLMALFIR